MEHSDLHQLDHSELTHHPIAGQADDLVRNALLESENKPAPSTSTPSRLTSPSTSRIHHSSGSRPGAATRGDIGDIRSGGSGDIDSSSVESRSSSFNQDISTRLVELKENHVTY